MECQRTHFVNVADNSYTTSALPVSVNVCALQLLTCSLPISLMFFSLFCFSTKTYLLCATKFSKMVWKLLFHLLPSELYFSRCLSFLVRCLCHSFCVFILSYLYPAFNFVLLLSKLFNSELFQLLFLHYSLFTIRSSLDYFYFRVAAVLPYTISY